MAKDLLKKCQDTLLEEVDIIKKILVYRMYILKIYKLIGKRSSNRKIGI